MNLETILMIVIGGFVGLVSVIIVVLRVPKRLKNEYFVSRWKEITSQCKDKTCWPGVLKDADKLLDRALKKRKFKGRTMGERMVSAQRTFTDNDATWFAHNVYKKITADPNFKLRESDVKDALVGFRQALRDLGALPENGKSRD